MALAVGSLFGPAMNVDGVGSRDSNALMYSSPALAGFKLQVVQSLAEAGPFAAGQAKLTEVGVGYSAGPFSADVVYAHLPEIANSQQSQTDYALGMQYVVAGGFKLMDSYFVHQGESLAAPGATAAVPGSKGTDRTC